MQIQPMTCYSQKTHNKSPLRTQKPAPQGSSVSQKKKFDMNISEILIPVLKDRFSERNYIIGSAPEPIAIFPAECKEIGDLSIYDDGTEATVLIRNITHHHINPYDEKLSEIEKAEWIVASVIDFLENLFLDRMLLWSIDQGRSGGGWFEIEENPSSDEIPPKADVFVWSHRIK